MIYTYGLTKVVSSSLTAELLKMAQSGLIDAIVDDLKDVKQYLARAFIVVPATNNRTLNTSIANPRDIEEGVTTHNNVDVRNIDDLRRITEQNLTKRRSEIGKVVALIKQELNRLENEHKKDRANELIASLYQNAEELRARELEKAHNRLRSEEDLSKYQQILDDFTGSIVNKQLYELTASLREAAANDDYDLMSSAHRLFKRQEV